MKLMSDTRQEQLIKAAETVLELSGLGSDPTAALKKVAQDDKLNAKEIDLVGAAVNNSKTLAVLQTERPEDRKANFPICNSEQVVHELYPDAKEELSQAAKDRRPLDKKAVDASYHDFNNYEFEPADAVRSYQATVQVAKTASVIDNRPAFGDMRIQIEESSIGFTAARDGAETCLSKVANELRRTDAPSFHRIEKLAYHAGVTPELVDMVYVLGGLEGIGQTRMTSQVKEASQIRALPEETRLLKTLMQADELWKQAADYLAVKEVLSEQLKAAEAEYFRVKTSKDKSPGSEAGISFEAKLDPISGIGKPFDGVIESGLGGGGEEMSNMVMDIAGQRGTASKDDLTSPLPTNTRQQLRNLSVRDSVERLMKDPYVGQHPLPDVIDAYNRAISVNPNFGEAEMASYIRHDLATEGGVPLDLQLRAGKNKGD